MKAYTLTRKRRGFTLVELLVVITIVIVLASLAFVGSQRVLRGAKSASSISNLREINTAIINASNEGFRNPNRIEGTYIPTGGQQNAPFSRFTWWDLVGANQGWAKEEGGAFVWNTLAKDTFLQNPLSERDFGGNSVDRGDFASQGDFAAGGYGMNYQLVAFLNIAGGDPNIRSPKIGQVPYPESTILVAESGDEWTESRYAPFSRRSIGDNFDGRCHVLMVDGHTELIDADILSSPAGIAFYALPDGAAKVRPPN